MGKYMRKTNGVTGEVAVMEVQSPLGVRTRAKTLALQRLQAAAGAAAVAEDGGGSYLQLRSRRLQKPAAAASLAENVRRRRKKGNLGTAEIGKGEENLENEKKIENEEEEGTRGNVAVNGGGGERVEEEAEDDGCFGENVLEFEGRERTTQESTPCNLITDPDNISAPASSTKPSRARARGSDAINRAQNLFQMPTTQEMDEFIAAEKQQQKQFKKLIEQNEQLVEAIRKSNTYRNEILREKNKIQKRKFDVAKMREENKILFTDLNSISDLEFRQYIQNEKRRIMQKRAQQW